MKPTWTAALAAALLLLAACSTPVRTVDGVRSVDATDFGADPTGVRDSAPAINAAIAALGEAGGVCRLPAGTYRLGLPADWDQQALRFRDRPAGEHPRLITLPDRTTLAGEGWATVLDVGGVPDRGRTIAIAARSRATRDGAVAEARDIHVRDLRISGSWADFRMNQNDEPGVPTAVQFNAVSGFSVRNVRIERFPGLSLIMVNCRLGLIEGNQIENSARDGCTAFGLFRDVRIANNLFRRIGDDAIAVNYMRTRARQDTDPEQCPSGIAITGNVIDHTISRGINLMHLRDSTVSGNTITGARFAGIRLAPDDELGIPWGEQRARNVAITGNTIRRTWWGRIDGYDHLSRAGGGNGIHIAHADLVAVSGNTVVESTRHGIALDDVLGAAVTGNLVSGTGHHGGWERRSRDVLWQANQWLATGGEALHQAPADEADRYLRKLPILSLRPWSELAPWMAGVQDADERALPDH